MLQLKKMSLFSKDLYKVKKIYNEAFPDNERISFGKLKIKTIDKNIELMGIYNENQIIGFFYLISNKDLSFILYFAIDKTTRSKGFGSKSLSLIKMYKPLNRIILLIEAPDENAINNTQRKKRKQFYSDNGYFYTSVNIHDKNENFELLSLNNSKVTKSECLGLIKKVCNRE